MEKEIKLNTNGFLNLFFGLILLFAPLGLIIYHEAWSLGVYVLLFILGIFWLTGLFIIQPNQTSVLTFFGKYQGTVKSNGFFWLNPFYTKKKVSLRVRNLESDVIKVNDQQGNPILISAIVVWKVIDTYKAVFNIEALEEVDPKTGMKKTKSEESYQKFIKIQTESALRKIAHTYPYDNIEEEKGGAQVICLRSGIDEINKSLAVEISDRLSLWALRLLRPGFQISPMPLRSLVPCFVVSRQRQLLPQDKRLSKGRLGWLNWH